MPNEEEILKAIFELNGFEVMGRNLEVSISEKKDKSTGKSTKAPKLNSQGKLYVKESYIPFKGNDKRGKR
jgi:RNA recognition motif-containing protein